MSEQDRFFARANALLDRLEQLLPAEQPPAAPQQTLAYRWIRSGYPGQLAGRAWDRTRGRLEGIDHVAAVRLDELLCIDRQKQLLVRNTRQFLAGLPANNALLWGPRGTGKSSLLKALLNDFSSQGLRLIEVEKSLLVDLPDIVSQLPDQGHRYIIYCDDLSFESGDPAYKALKVILDGSLSRVPDNLLIYATSNRRHLLPEYQQDNQASQMIDGELHHGEAVEEKISLSERFGLWLAFHPFSQDDYLTIVEYWLGQMGIAELTDETRQQALRWALEHGSRSGRIAFQFSRDFSGRRKLEQQTDTPADDNA